MMQATPLFFVVAYLKEHAAIELQQIDHMLLSANEMRASHSMIKMRCLQHDGIFSLASESCFLKT